ncbi:MAG TPA: MotA/TolQ/ExbB proton channel family protein [Fibrobacteraceae bacterium]|nr:MotA/TolQ/ExbB proton channel family protein [Fibrobacteraceae bacterium]
MPLSLSTLLGVVFGSLIVVWGISGATDNPKAFLDYPSLLIVVGGTITSTFIGFRARYIIKALLALPLIFVRQKIGPESLRSDVQRVLNWNKRIQSGGAKALDELASNPKEDEFIRYLFGLVATGYKEEELRSFATTQIEEAYFRSLQTPNILAFMASAAPAFGMLGTLIGLIAMLDKLEDPSKMGPGLAVALITTLYGVIAARFIFLPSSTKVKQLLGIQRFQHYLFLEGVALILQKRSPLYIQDCLNSFLDSKYRLVTNSSSSGKESTGKS